MQRFHSNSSHDTFDDDDDDAGCWMLDAGWCVYVIVMWQRRMMLTTMTMVALLRHQCWPQTLAAP